MQVRRSLSVYLALAIWLVIGASGSVVAEPQSRRESRVSPSTMRNMVLYVRDQYGDLTANAEIVMRERYTYRLVGEVTTNEFGYAQIALNTATWYVAQVYFHDCDSREFWTYKYIGPDDWGSIYPYGVKKLQRDDPWIDQVTLPETELEPSVPAQVTVDIAHALTQTNFGLYCRMRLIIDDDGQLPYLYEHLSYEQLIADGFQPFSFAPTLDQPGDYMVRLILERRFEGNAWEVADEGCWSWQIAVAELRAPLDGLVYLDMNSNGRLDASEPLAPGAVMYLYDGQGDLVDMATSDARGLFRFEGLVLADYRLRIAEVPQGLGRPRPVYAVTLSPETIGRPLELALDPWRVQLPWITR